MRALEEYIATGDRSHLEQFCLRERPRLERLVRRFKVEGYDLQDLTQEAFLAALTWAEDVRAMRPLAQETAEEAIIAHLRRVKREQERRDPKRPLVRVNGYSLEGLYDDDAGARTDSDLDALILLWAAQSVCESDEEERLLSLLVEGSGYRVICQELRVNRPCAKSRVLRFRRRLHRGVYETDAG